MPDYSDADLDWLQAHDPGLKPHAAIKDGETCPRCSQPNADACPPAPIDREAWHRDAIRQAGEHALRHPELVDDHSDADAGL